MHIYLHYSNNNYFDIFKIVYDSRIEDLNFLAQIAKIFILNTCDYI
jgi:hypothetical protein